MADSLKQLQATFERIILDPKYKQPLVLLKAIRNGAVYGTKVRFPHALVMIFLFRSGTVQEKIKLVYKATRQHARNLALFAFLYKSSMLMLRKASGDKQHHSHTFLAGLFGGYWVFGHGKRATSSVNQQIVIYVFARVVLALAKLAVQPPGDNALVGSHYGGHGGAGFLGLNAEHTKAVQRYAWPVFASVSWASVMWLFEGYPDTLQNSLRSSMTYIYANAEKWDSSRNFLLHNK
ncbi:Peroxisomal membrane protein 4 [Fulvia fulva]|uniref:Peroxisomal membrane protein 4 n=1 Tax=Passalora fulva TaxID=5499 RepID=A0A9Q8L6U3_PASFU|nr:Peroxisomal membrane protein 4 [Fulvia fulva]KAK4634544.1 Peroxisomal membrane protein 4 [Fulvia fulva]KAK4636636.1 Peroxisomal membrane protein 4 [Fulvia fulva]UJO11877.1 Peroxisomal membrane protein 4 [Fulvia fulva]WPV09948.1 Peroxisomal membrane protein 4 [Fulvia fulva]WPV24676.1 Peroxisomal membrane protein 4 [Fulvia fulva]